MTIEQNIAPITIILVGTFIALGLLSRLFLSKINIPPIIGYIAIGFFTKWLDLHYNFLNNQTIHPLEFLAEAGIILLLFKAGLESSIESLIKQLPQASWIWFWNVLISGSSGFIAAFYILDISLIPSLFIATALTATSIAISVSLWQKNNMLKSQKGQLMLDVAQLDDLSSIALLALLLSILPSLNGSVESLSYAEIAKIITKFGAILIAFCVLCVILSLKIVPHIYNFISKKQSPSASMMIIVSIGFIIAALANMIGLSLAIGAFFAGLAFSNHNKAIKCESYYAALYDFFTPFFFILIGLKINPELLSGSFFIIFTLFSAAIIGKIIGTYPAAIPYVGSSGAAIIAVSMIPRAEIAMVVLQQGLSLGEWAMPQSIFSAMSIVIIGTIIISPFALEWILKNNKVT